MMQSLRNRAGDAAAKPITPPPPPSSMGSLSKTRRPRGRSLAKKHQRLQYILIFLIGSIILAYVIVIKYVNDEGTQDQQLPLPAGADADADAKEKKNLRKYLSSVHGTPEGQKLLREQQVHVRKELSELIPKLQRMKEKYPVSDRGKRTNKNLFKAYSKKNRVSLPKKYDKKTGALVYEPITAVRKEDLLDMGYDQKQIDAMGNITHDEAIKGRHRLVDILNEAGIEDIDPEAISVLPKWADVKRLYGDKPVVLGLERCEQFRMEADPVDMSMGQAGMFNTGTNPMAMYVSNNCMIPSNQNDKAKGTRWQVPWGKHRLASEKLTNTAGHDFRTNKTNVLPIVLVRDPYSWLQSMCRHKYEARWKHSDKMCPNLAEKELNKDGSPKKVPMFVKYNPPVPFDSVADYWGDWYKEYLEADYPRLIVRFEDIQFHARELIETICQCVGAVPREKDSLFRYVVDSAKWGAAHKSKSNMISAMVKYGTDKNRFNGMTENDWLVADQVFSPELMDLFGYEQPKKLREKKLKASA